MASKYRLAIKVEERNHEASEAEKNADTKKATRLYEQNITEDYADKLAFERLMIIYRKQKDYKNELRVIERGIQLFQQNIEEHLQRSLAKRVDAAKLKQLSNAIIKKSGLKKEELSFPDPIDKWIKRKEIVKQKLKKS